MLVRLVDFLRKKAITAFLVSLTGGGKNLDDTDDGLSSSVDTWMLLRDVEVNGERTRLIHVLEARGLPHSNQVRDMLSGADRLVSVYMRRRPVLTAGTAVAHAWRAAAA